MPSRILRFPLAAYKVGAPYVLTMPKGATVLCVTAEKDLPTIWANCPDVHGASAEFETHTFYLLYTGSELPANLGSSGGCLRYHATVFIYDGEIVLHVFEQIEWSKP